MRATTLLVNPWSTTPAHFLTVPGIVGVRMILVQVVRPSWRAITAPSLPKMMALASSIHAQDAPHQWRATTTQPPRWMTTHATIQVAQDAPTQGRATSTPAQPSKTGHVNSQVVLGVQALKRATSTAAPPSTMGLAITRHVQDAMAFLSAG